MIELFSNSSKSSALELYKNSGHIFPFIFSVLAGLQNGRIFANDEQKMTSIMVMHDFGWSHIFGERDENFRREIEEFIFEYESFSCAKVRLFGPDDFWLEDFYKYAEQSERCQFRLENNNYKAESPEKFSIKQITTENSRLVDDALNMHLFNRNWPSFEAFQNSAIGFFAEKNDEICAICYSCAIAGDVHEIDIFTHEKFRNQGIGLEVAKSFINYVLREGLIPNWDCFTNNTGSMKLAEALGFKTVNKPYKFFTYNRRKCESNKKFYS